MRSWTKTNKPADFATWCALNAKLVASATSADWHQLRDETNRVPPLRAKSATRERLCDDQRSVCAYCESRIGYDASATSIEHFEARSANPSRIFDWDNMVGVCTCGEPAARNTQKPGAPMERYCEPARGALPLAVRPYGPAGSREALVRFTRKGLMQSDHPGITGDIQTLNLNHGVLVGNRHDALDELQEALRTGGDWTKAGLQKQRRRLLDQSQPAAPFLTCLLFHLDRWIRNRP